MLRVTGAWTGLLRDWLDREGLAAVQIRAALARWSRQESVPVLAWRTLLEQAVTLVPGRTTPELAIGAGVAPAHVGVLGYLVLASDTLGDAVRAYQRYERLFYNLNLVEVVSFDDQVEIRWPQSTSELGQLSDGAAIAALLTFLQGQLERAPRLTQVGFRHGVDAKAAAAYEAFFDCPVLFQEPYVRIRFPAAFLKTPMLRRDPVLHQLLDHQAQSLLHALPGDSELELLLQQVLLRIMADGEPTLARMAQAVHMAPRTLQRKLANHGLSWQQWLDRTRQQLAEQYLADHSLSLSDVALLLGFSEQSTFTRAWRRWTGVSPGRWRRQNLP